MNSFPKRKIVHTEDDSTTIYFPEFDEHYHSVHGAMQESKHVFIESGWKKVAEKKKEISILEIGLGTGLNAFLVMLESLGDGSLKIFYEALEKFPVDLSDVLQLNYADDENIKYFLALHESKWNEENFLLDNFTLKKNKIALEDFIPKENIYDLIFFDAFSPEKQPELWTEEIFRKMFSSMKPGGILVTYCAKGQVRRNMIAAGFSVERLAGPPGKREMLRAGKI